MDEQSTKIDRYQEIRRPNVAYDVLKWDRLRWCDFVDNGPPAWAAVKTDLDERSEDGTGIAREVFARLASDWTKPLDPAPRGAKWAQAIHRACDEVPEFEQLRSRLQADPENRDILAGVAALGFLSDALRAVPKPKKPAPSPQERERNLEGLRDILGDRQDPKAQKALAEAEQAVVDAEAQADALEPDADDIRRAVRRAVARAGEAVEEAEQGLAMFGMQPGLGGGHHGVASTPEEKMDLLKKVRGNGTLHQIAALAGRLRNVARSTRRTRVQTRAAGAIQGIRLSGEVSDATLPDELALLGTAAGRALFATKIADGALLNYRYGDAAPEGHGPIVVLIDNSGSMQSPVAGGATAEVWSKAIALALLGIALEDGRGFAIVHFSGRVEKVSEWPAGTKPTPADLLDALMFFSGGGTDFMPALDEARRIIDGSAYFEKADVLLITDGYEDMAQVHRASWDAYKHRTQSKCLGVVIGDARQDPFGTMADLCDEVFDLTDLKDGARKAEQAIFNV